MMPLHHLHHPTASQSPDSDAAMLVLRYQNKKDISE